MKTEARRFRIAAATDILDMTVEVLGRQFRDRVPQGEKDREVVQHHPVELVAPKGIPLPTRASEPRPSLHVQGGDAGNVYESAEVLPSLD